MRYGLSSVAMFVAAAVLLSVQGMADTEEEGVPPPRVVTEREFHKQRLRVADVVAAPFYIPHRFMNLVLFPVGRATAWVMENQVPDRVVDLLTDETKRIFFIPFVDYSSSDLLSVGGLFSYKNIFYEKKNLRVSGSIAMNLDRSASTSFSKSPSLNDPFFYRLAVTYNLDRDSDFYGVGVNSSTRDKSIFANTNAGFSLSTGWKFRKLRFLSISGRFGLQYSGARRGTGPKSIRYVEETFPLAELSGFGESITWMRYGVRLEYDSRLPSGYPFRGNLITLGANPYLDVDGRFNHILLAASASTLFDLYRKTSVLVLTLRFKSAEELGGEIPFYHLPSADALRGFSSNRFRDRRSLVGSVDYRFKLWTSIRSNPVFLIGSLFVDLGKPFHDMDSLVRDGVKYSVGAELIYTTRKKFMARGRIGYGGEAIETKISIGSVF